MPGLIENAIDPTKPIPNPLDNPSQITGAKSFGYDPSIGTVNMPTDTVSGQLAAILGKDNPYVTRARTSAAGVANSRGLINSTMAAQAGEAAASSASKRARRKSASFC